jgi:NAD(P)-dependent dehydrogenase (short-subunit alcohol dehydrogenase family)
MTRLVSGQRAVVTGGGTGLGFATAKRLLEHGAHVLIAGRRTDVLDSAAADDRTLLGRAGEPEEIGDAVVWLASPLATFVTGHILGVDGGLGIDMGEDFEGMARMIHGDNVMDAALGRT